MGGARAIAPAAQYARPASLCPAAPRIRSALRVYAQTLRFVRIRRAFFWGAGYRACGAIRPAGVAMPGCAAHTLRFARLCANASLCAHTPRFFLGRGLSRLRRNTPGRRRYARLRRAYAPLCASMRKRFASCAYAALFRVFDAPCPVVAAQAQKKTFSQKNCLTPHALLRKTRVTPTP